MLETSATIDAMLGKEIPKNGMKITAWKKITEKKIITNDTLKIPSEYYKRE